MGGVTLRQPQPQEMTGDLAMRSIPVLSIPIWMTTVISIRSFIAFAWPERAAVPAAAERLDENDSAPTSRAAFSPNDSRAVRQF